MKHFGDITQLSGYDLPVVDVITGGSPCQDLSVAGKRAGLAGERSGLFMEQIRIVKEMRERDRESGLSGYLVRPRYMVWENVPGAFSSNGGEDFKAVIEEIVKIVEPEVPDLHTVVQGGWTKSGCVYSSLGEWSIAWRVHDAQFWGVPQRRKRISLVADFGGLSAPEILFERKGLSRDSEPCGAAREEAARAVGSGADSASGAMNPWDSQSARVYPDSGVWHRLNANENGGQSRDSVLQSASVGVDIYPIEGNGARPSHQGPGYVNANDPSFTLNAVELHGVAKCAVYENHSQDSRYKPLGEVSETVNAKYGTGGNNQPLVVSDVLPFDTTQITSPQNGNNPHYGDPCHPLAAQAHVPSIASPSIVRRLTPLECERLQGMPDNWSKYGVNEKGEIYELPDSARYRLQGNGIATPFWRYLLKRISAQYERTPMLGSLFDGQGSFPMIWESINGYGTALWSSEIEKHAIAVAKYHFPEETTNE